MVHSCLLDSDNLSSCWDCVRDYRGGKMRVDLRKDAIDRYFDAMNKSLSEKLNNISNKVSNNNKIFEDAEVGDIVWHFLYGYGEITNSIVQINSLFGSNESYDLVAKFGDKEVKFKVDGKIDDKDINPSIFWSETNFNTPQNPNRILKLEKLLKKLEVKKFEAHKKNFRIVWAFNLNKIKMCMLSCEQSPTELFFTKESIEKFIKETKRMNITKEEFFKAYKKVFGGNN